MSLCSKSIARWKRETLHISQPLVPSKLKPSLGTTFFPPKLLSIPESSQIPLTPPLPLRPTRKSLANASWMEDDFVPQPSFAHRLSRAWQVVFPTRRKGPSVAEVAKERLRLVLYSDREEFHPRLKKKLCGDIVTAMGDFLDVAVEDEDDVIFRVTRDPVVGSIYNVSVPVKRVKPALQKAS
ncbi:unnamed protein product [Closterium sp. NIES-65]|nr:unnamed protein product [Closterium sp. NIES-65]